MKSVVIHSARDLRIEDRPARDPGAGQVEIRVAAGGSAGLTFITTITAASELSG